MCILAAVSALYKEFAVGSTAYPASPQIATWPAGASAASPGALAAWSPEFHKYRVVGGVSGGDVFVSWDGVNDAGRVPFGPDSAGGLVLPDVFPVYYRAAWFRTALAGGTATVGAGFYTKQ